MKQPTPVIRKLPVHVKTCTLFVGVLLMTNLVEVALANPYPLEISLLSGLPSCGGIITDGTDPTCWKMAWKMQSLSSVEVLGFDRWACAYRVMNVATGETTTTYPPIDRIGCFANADGDITTGVGKLSTGYVLYLDTANTLLVTGDYQLRSIDLSTKVVTTLAGYAAVPGDVSGTGTAARIGVLEGPVTLSSGNHVFMDTTYFKFRYFDPSTNYVGHFAGSGTSGYQEGTDTTIQIIGGGSPVDLVMVDSTHFVFNDAAVRLRFLNVDTKESSYITGSLTNVYSPMVLGDASTAIFNANSITLWRDSLLIAVQNHWCILQLTPISAQGTVSSFAGECGTQGTHADLVAGGNEETFRFQLPQYIHANPYDDNLIYITDGGSSYLKIELGPSSRTATDSATQSTTITPPDTATRTFSLTPSVTPTLELTSTASLVPTESDSVTVTGTLTESLTTTITPPPTLSQSFSITASLSPSQSDSESCTSTISPPNTPSSTYSVSGTLSKSESVSTSVSSTLSLTGSLSATDESVSASHTTSLSLSGTPPPTLTSTVSLSSTRSPTPSLSVTTSVSTSYSLSTTQSGSLTVTATITPPPTPTSTFSLTTTRSSTLSPSPTLSSTRSETQTLSASVSSSESKSHTRSETQSLSASVSSSESKSRTRSETQTASSTLTETKDTQSFSLSSSMSVTSTASLSTSASLEVYCGGLIEEHCKIYNQTCNTTEDGACYHNNCTSFSGSQALCVRSGCIWNKYTKCRKPPECRDVTTMPLCQLLYSCRWEMDSGRCVVDRTPCNEQLTPADCISSSCSWNALAIPYQCFKPILHPSLCVLETVKTVCIQQKCFWLRGTQECVGWDVTCEELPPAPSSCSFLPLCYYGDDTRKCISLEGFDFGSLDYTKIVTSITPSIEFPDAEFTAEFIGTVLDPLENNITVVNASVSNCNSTTAKPITNGTVVHLSSYDFDRVSNIVKVKIADAGSYRFCIRANESMSLGPFPSRGSTNVTINVSDPVVESCATDPGTAYTAVPFDIRVQGQFLDPRFGRYLLVDYNDSCPVEANSSFVDVLRSESDGTVVGRAASYPGGFYGLCYTNRGNRVSRCPDSLYVSGVPPWMNETLLREVAGRLPRIEGQDMLTYNSRHCKSMTKANETRGLMLHPLHYQFQFGNGVEPYLGDETCVFGIAPMYVQGFQSPVNRVLVVEMLYASMNIGDYILIFSSATVNEGVVPCSASTSYRDCLAAGCSWEWEQQECFADTSKVYCPKYLPGFALQRVVSYETFLDTGERLVIATSADHGFMFLVCSPNGNIDGLGTQLQYGVQSTYCPNDCTDSTGTRNGECRLLKPNHYVCVCNNGFAGKDCSRPARCRGSGPSSIALQGYSLNETLSMEDTACAVLATAVPSVAPSSKGRALNMAQYGIGFRIGEVHMKGNVTDCAKYYIAFRKGSYTGEVVTKLCPNDLQRNPAEPLRMLLSDTDSVYVEYAGDPGDNFTLSFVAVSLVCPGRNGPSGVPRTEEEVCEGRGKCIDSDYGRTTGALPHSSRTCECKSPWASTFTAGGECDTCAFGFQKKSFPLCIPATICAANCSLYGKCVQGVGCQCLPGRYGLDCQLLDDGEREGQLMYRLPLNAHDAGNVLRAGAIDRTLMQCSFPGSDRPCRADPRDKGRVYPQQSKGITDSVSSIFGRRRQKQEGNESYLNRSSTDDVGLAFNTLSILDTYPDTVRIDNITGSGFDISGTFTIAAWVRLTGRSNGFLFAKVDSAFMIDGRSPALERAYLDIEDRARPEKDLLVAQANDTITTHTGIYFDGAQKRVSLLVTNIDARISGKAESKEDWFYVRHFRLGEKAGELYDGTWHFFALRIYAKDHRKEAQVFIDGETQPADPNFVQCLPYIPPLSKRLHYSTGNLTLGEVLVGTSLMWGYRLKGSLDELHVYRTPLNPATIPRIGGLLGTVRVATSAAIVMLLLTLLTTSGYLVVTIVKLVKQVRGRSQSGEKEDTPQEPDQEDEQPQEELRRTAGRKQDGGQEEERKVAFALDEEPSIEVEATQEVDSTDREESVYSPLEVMHRRTKGGDEGGGDSSEEEEDEEGNVLHDVESFANIRTSQQEQTSSPPPPDSADEKKPNALGVSCRTPEDIELELEVSYLDDEKDKPLSSDPDDQSVNASPVGGRGAIVNIPPGDSPEIIALETPDTNTTTNRSAGVDTVVEVEHKGHQPQGVEFSRYEQLPYEKELHRLQMMKDENDENDDEVLPVAARVDFTKKFFEERCQLEDVSSLVAGSVLQWILALKAEEATKKDNTKRTVTVVGSSASKSRQLSSGMTTSVSGTEAANSATTVNASWQILSQMLATMEFPEQFAVWSGFVHFLAFDFTSALGAIFAAAFIGLSIVGFICFGVLAVIQFLTKSRSRSETETYLVTKYEEWRKALDDGEEYKQKRTKKFRLTLIAATVLSLLYTPLTSLSVSSLFCAPAIMCIFDCYNEPTHRVLVGFAVPVLVLLVLGFPLLVWYSVHRARVHYDEYIGTYDADVKARHWDVYVDVMDDPFASHFLPFRYRSSFFQVLLLLHRTVMTLAIVALPSESLSQFVVATIIQVVFSLICLKTLPYRKPALNIILCAMQLWLTVILLLRSVEFLTLDSASVGVAMSVLTGLMVASTVLVVVVVAGRFLYGRLKAKKEMEQEKVDNNEEDRIECVEQSRESEEQEKNERIANGEPQPSSFDGVAPSF